ncbi:right-handed parallel beta-helix repeat-containing protein [Natronospora cellulosivora (SeqCode)]
MEGTVLIPEGTFNIGHGIDLYEGVSIVGEGMDESVIKNIAASGFTRNSFIANSRHYSDDRILGIEIKDLTFDIDMYNLDTWIGGIWIEEYFKDLTIERVRMTNGGGNIIRLMKDSVIRDSIFDNMDGRALSTGWENRPNLRFRNNLIEDNQFIRTADAPTGPGINFSRAEDNIFRGNELININPGGDSYGGIRLPNDSHRNLIEDNVVKNFPRGIWVMSGSQDNEVRANTVIDSSIVALFMNNSHEDTIPTSGNIFANNIIIQENPEYESNPPGLIHLHEDHDNMLRDNTVEGNKITISATYYENFKANIQANERDWSYELIEDVVLLAQGAELESRNNVVRDNELIVLDDPFYIEIENVADGETYNDPVQPVVSIVDEDGEELTNISYEMTLNGEEYTGEEIDVHGSHTLRIEASGEQNIRIMTVRFELDLFEIAITDVEADKVYVDKEVTPLVTVNNKGSEDVDYEKELLLIQGENDAIIYDGSPISDYDNYQLIVNLKQNGDVVLSRSLEFEIVREANLELHINNITEGETYYTSIVPEIIVLNDGDDVTDDADIYISLNNEQFLPGTEIEEMGYYLLEVEAFYNGGYGITTVGFEVLEDGVVVFDWFEIEHDRYWNDGGWTWDRETSNIIHNENLDYVKTGLSSMEIVRDGWVSDARIRNWHRNWPEDWADYSEFSFWVYIEDVSELYHGFVIQFHGGSSPYELVPVDSFEDGWNEIVIDLNDLGVADVGWVEIILRDETPQNWYMDKALLRK